MPTLKIIGCGDAFGSGGLMNTCFHVQATDSTFLIDCGATTLPALKKFGIEITDLEVIFISHLHGDHFAGLPFLLLNLAILGHRKKIVIVSPPGCQTKVQKLLDLFYPGSPVIEKLNIEFREFKAHQSLKIKNLKFTAIPVEHSRRSLPHGMRIEVDEKVISFSGDTNWTENLVKISSGADIFLCECNFFRSRVKGHLDYQTLMQNIHKLHHKRILLTHHGDELLENINQVELDLAEEGKEYRI